MILKGYIFTYLYLLLILLLSSVLNKYFNIKQSITRKLVHISISYCYVIFYKYLKESIHPVIISVSFIFFNYLSYKYDIFKGMENDKQSLGTIYYPISVAIMALITYFNNDFYPFFGIGLFCMAFGDGLAPLISSKVKSRKIYKEKTIVGALTVFIVSLIVVVIFNNIFLLNMNIISILIISLISMLLELVGIKGLDNLYLPIGISIISYLIGGF